MLQQSKISPLKIDRALCCPYYIKEDSMDILYSRLLDSIREKCQRDGWYCGGLATVEVQLKETPADRLLLPLDSAGRS
jgi:hypothetical protein